MTEVKAETRSLRTLIENLTSQFLAFKTEVAREFGSIRAELAKDLGMFRTEVANQFGALAKEHGDFKAEVAKEFGSLRTSLKRAKLWMMITGLGTILSVWGAALALARLLQR